MTCNHAYFLVLFETDARYTRTTRVSLHIALRVPKDISKTVKYMSYLLLIEVSLNMNWIEIKGNMQNIYMLYIQLS